MRLLPTRQLAAIACGVTVLALLAPAAVAAEPAFWEVPGPSEAPARVIGGYARGCLGGAMPIAPDGPGFQVMRLSRERYYGHPQLIRVIEELATEAQAQGWNGILVGDMAQARGGPMLSGHRSHQSGLDVDIWFVPAPAYTLTQQEREDWGAYPVVLPDGITLDRDRWTDAHVRLLATAARHPDVDRVFVNAVIKKELCRTATGEHTWLHKIRPWWGHDDHYHVRLGCPAGETACEDQDAIPPGDGCDASLDWWLSDEAFAELRKPKPPRRLQTLDDLPAGCRDVLLGG